MRIHPGDGSFRPTLFVGVGRYGRLMLQILKYYLVQLGEGEIPKGASLLWIGQVGTLQETLADGYCQLKEEEQVKSSDIDNTIRALNMPDNAHKFTFIQNNLINPPENRFRIHFFASLAESECCLAPDIAWWLRLKFPERIINIALWLGMHAIEQADADNGKIAAARTAALREISRFMSGKGQVMSGVDFARPITAPLMFDAILAFDGNSDKLDAKHSFAAARGLAPAILALLQNGLFDQQLQNATTAVGNLVFNTVASFTYYFPREEIRRVCEARLAEQILFAESDVMRSLPGGVFPIRGDERQLTFVKCNSQQRQTILQEVNDFFRGGDSQTSQYNTLFNWLATGVADSRLILSIVGDRDLPGAWRVRLQKYLNHRLNDFQHHDDLSAFIWLRCFLDCAREFINSRYEGKYDPIFRVLEAVIKEHIAQVDEWQSSISDQPAKPGLLSLTRKSYREKLAFLKQEMESTSSVQAVLDSPSNDLPDISDTFFQQFYRTEAVFRDFANRLVWRWNIAENNQVNLSINMDAESFSVRTISELLTAILKHASFNTKTPTANPFAVLSHLSQQKVNRVLERQASHLTWETASSSVQFTNYLLTSDPEQIHQWGKGNSLETTPGDILKVKDQTRLTFLRLTYGIPPESVPILARAAPVYIEVPHIHAEEKYAADLETRNFKNARLTFHSHFVRLMHNPAAFEIAMSCTFYGLLTETEVNGHPGWFIDLRSRGQHVIPLWADDIYPPQNIEQALENFLINIPYQSLHNGHPLFRTNEEATLERIRTVLRSCATTPQIQLRDQKREINLKIQQWVGSANPFEQSLGTYIKHLYQQKFGNK